MTVLFRITQNELTPIKRKALTSEELLEDRIMKDPSLVGLDVLVIGRQVVTDYSGRIDILAIDREGNLAIIELKRDRTPREIVAQVLDYASWVVKLSTKRIHEIAMEKLNKRLEDAFYEKYKSPLPEILNSNHTMVIVASELDASSKRIVEYLAEAHGVSINTTFFNIFEENGQQILATNWLMDQEEVIERSDSKKKMPWSGLWYVNAGHGSTRSWEDMRKYGFLAAGDGRVYSSRLELLKFGDPVFAYQKKEGYVGYGTVTHEAVVARSFEVEGTPLLEQPLVEPNLGHDKDDPELAEYVVGIKWHKSFPVSEAESFPGIFANPNIVCKLRDPKTINFLKHVFEAS